MNFGTISAFFLALPLLTAPAVQGVAAPRPEAVDAAVTAFLGSEEMPASVTLPIDTGPVAEDSTRTWDVLLGLAVIGGLIALGFALRGIRPGLNPVLFAAVVLALLYLFAVDDLFWKFDGVTVDEAGIGVKDRLAGPTTLKWSDVQEISAGPGKVFPAFMADERLVLRAGDGTEIVVPGWVPGRAGVARAVSDGLGGTSR